LLHLLVQCGFNVVAGHLHHGQREEAEAEMEQCARFAEALNVPFVSGRADVPRMARELKIGLEEAGRNARYAFFHQAASQTDCSLIATAHTRTDQAETVLLNLIRGTGMAGLSGMPEVRDGIIRPLLSFTRAETQAYCREHGLWTHDDPANTDPAHSRSRIRVQVSPQLAQINPAFEANIVRSAAILREEDAFLNGVAASALEQAEAPLNGDLNFLTRHVEIAFDRRVLDSLPTVLFKRAARLATTALGGDLTFDQTMALANGYASELQGSVTAEGGKVVLEWTADRLHVRQLSPTEPFRYPLTVPGETESLEFGWRFTAHTDPAPEERVRASLRAHLDPAKVMGSLYFRTASTGDTIQPLGFGGTRKISDLLGEAKLTSAARARLPIVCDLVGPLWVPGICLGERAAAEPGQTDALSVRLQPTTNSTEA
jgi:tRNA(Ile)-lysidine synthase